MLHRRLARDITVNQHIAHIPVHEHLIRQEIKSSSLLEAAI